MQTYFTFNHMIFVLHMYCEVKNMGSFKIPSIPPTTNKTVRFPNDIIEAVEKAITGKDSNFSQFVIEAVRLALEDLKQQEQENNKKE
ncbi:hypothetical protein SDC9_180956 [bioreactor metagenome]|uniref:Ribbon-helix-helix protein CopG domain-containing protein n=1 Tax=bioreactor metagenome TaxID=1076179 RepID=A0A645H361_9ZZZZ